MTCPPEKEQEMMERDWPSDKAHYLAWPELIFLALPNTQGYLKESKAFWKMLLKTHLLFAKQAPGTGGDTKIHKTSLFP